MRVSLLLLAGVLVAGCGGLDFGGAPGGSACCDFMTAGVHTCNDYTTDSGTSLSAFKTTCTSQNNVLGGSCSHAGAVGGCKTSMAAGGVTSTVTTWTYSGALADAKAECAKGSGTFESP